jgi:tape measure domain-containing protein
MAAMAAAAVSAQQAIQFLRASVSAGVQFEGMQTQFAFANGGDIRKAAEEMDFARKLSGQLGLELIGASKAYARLQAAAMGTALEGRRTQDIFRAVASAGAVMGLSADEQAGALLAISQMMSKGTVMAEELKGQLGERLPGAFQIAARAMGVTTSELQKMLEAGQVMSADFLPKFAAALQASVNGALPAAEASARAQLQRLENAFTEFKLRIANSGLLDKVAEQLERVLDHIGNMADSGELDRLAEMFANTFGAAVEFLSNASIMATQFADTLGPLATALGAIMVGGRALALLGASAAGVAAAGEAAAGAAAGFGLLAGAIRLLKSLTVGGLILTGVTALIEWGAAASEARSHSEALDAQVQALIAANSEHASAAMRDADGIREFGDEAFRSYQKAIEGARDYAAAKVVDLTQKNKDGKFDDEIAFYRSQAAAYNEYLETIVAGERLRRDQVRLTGRIQQLEADREKRLAGEVTQTRKEALESQIKDYEKLVEAIRQARGEAQKEAEAAKKRAQELRSEAASARQSAQDKAQDIREKDLPDDVKRQRDAARADDALSQGQYYAAAAAAAQLDGRGEAFKNYAKQAEEFLARAMSFAEKSQDADKVEDIGKAQESLKNAMAKAEDAKAASAEQQAAVLMEKLTEIQGRLTEMTGEVKVLQIDADITAAMGELATIEQKIAALPDSKTITINVVEVSNAPRDTSNMTYQEKLDAIPARAYGGPLPGFAPHDRADNMIYRGTPGEWVIQRRAVRYWGPEFMAAINGMRMPRFAFGGELGGSMVSRLRVPSISPAGAAGRGGAPDVFDFGALGKVRVSKTADTAKDVAAVLKRAALGWGNR